jgi:hypothetical protein
LNLFYLSHCRCKALFLRDHPQRDTHTLRRSPLDECSTRRRGLYLHNNTHETNIQTPSGIRTRDPSIARPQTHALHALQPRPACETKRNTNRLCGQNAEILIVNAGGTLCLQRLFGRCSSSVIQSAPIRTVCVTDEDEALVDHLTGNTSSAPRQTRPRVTSPTINPTDSTETKPRPPDDKTPPNHRYHGMSKCNAT